jgi:hypothetical protein
MTKQESDSLFKVTSPIYVDCEKFITKGESTYKLAGIKHSSKKIKILTKELVLSGKWMNFLGQHKPIFTKARFNLFVIDRNNLSLDSLLKYKSGHLRTGKYFMPKSRVLTPTQNPIYGFNLYFKKNLLHRILFRQRNNSYAIYNEKFILIVQFKKYKGKKAYPNGYFNIIPLYLLDGFVDDKVFFFAEI